MDIGIKRLSRDESKAPIDKNSILCKIIVMVNSITDQKMYEISYLITSVIKEEEAFAQNQKIKNLITELGGAVTDEWPPKRKTLAYEIKKQSSAYFVNLQFNLKTSDLRSFEKKIKLEKNILRYLITVIDKTQLKEMNKNREVTREKFKKVLAPKTISEDKAEIEELDKKLEEILKKI
ncbi:30S ribosomal protein S6 [Candidatus Azambacteria bacterium]|nr:30S ribosomal protein S6 [Candidatus Azambacteria bacterium]